jgi:DNA-binding transcriptional MocR family regulator
MDDIKEHMKKQANIIAPKFDVVLKTLNKELSDKGIAEWNEPTGGYFISLNVIDGCAKRAIELAKNAGVAMTPAGSTFPYKKDPRDRNIRIAPTYPPIEELKVAIELFCICVQLAAAEKLLTAN